MDHYVNMIKLMTDMVYTANYYANTIQIIKTKTLNQIIFFKATPHEIYEAFMDSRTHSEFTGCKAEIIREVGGKFVIDDYLTGITTELVPDEKIVQSWRAAEDNWPKKHFSKLTIILNEEKEGTKLEITQNGVPAECFESINEGWTNHYWKPLKLFLEK